MRSVSRAQGSMPGELDRRMHERRPTNNCWPGCGPASSLAIGPRALGVSGHDLLADEVSRPTSDRAPDASRGVARTCQTAAVAGGYRRTVDERRRAESARPGIHRRVNEPQMGRGLHLPLDRRSLALRAAVVDLFSRRVVGWFMRATMTAQLVTAALVKAIWRRGKPQAVVRHSDRGSQNTSEPFQRLLADHGVICSMSRAGNVGDNAAMESFFSSLKTERTAAKTYRTRARADVLNYRALLQSQATPPPHSPISVRWSAKDRQN